MKAVAPRFHLARYRFTLRPVDLLSVPERNKGNMLRGAFGCAFKAMACAFGGGASRGSTCRERCQLPDTCPYGVVFETSPPAGTERLRLNQDVPRPFVIKPPLTLQTCYGPGDLLIFDVVLIGRGIGYLPYFILA